MNEDQQVINSLTDLDEGQVDIITRLDKIMARFDSLESSLKILEERIPILEKKLKNVVADGTRLAIKEASETPRRNWFTKMLKGGENHVKS